MTLRTRKQASDAGHTRYFTGKPCIKGHVAERMVAGRGCVVCLKSHKRRWERANPAGQAARSRKWYLENREKANAATRAWSAKNLDKEAAKTARRRAATLRATPDWADFDAIESLYTLARVYRDFGHEVEVDHIAPLRGRRVCGLHVHQNLQVIPKLINLSKSNKFDA